jgi:hypothetical protein
MPSLCDFFCRTGERPFTRRCARLGFVAGLAGLTVLALFAVETAGAANDAPQPQAVRAKYAPFLPVVSSEGELAVYEGDPDLPVVDCASLPAGRTMVALVFGQSNASNTVDTGYDAVKPVYAFSDGSCRRVRDAIPGATGAKGSSWARLGDRVVASGLYDAVVFVDIARGGSSILHWSRGGQFHDLLTGSLDALAAHGLPVTHVLFHQGEADCAMGLSRQEYGAVLAELLGDVRAHADPRTEIFVSRASLFLDPACGDRANPGCYRSCPAVTTAQTEAADPERRIFAGPNTDLLVPWFDRNDGYHFTSRAADRFAAAWMPLLVRGDAPQRQIR